MPQVSAESVLMNFPNEPNGMAIQLKRNALCVEETIFSRIIRTNFRPSKTVPWFRQSAAGLSLSRSKFDPCGNCDGQNVRGKIYQTYKIIIIKIYIKTLFTVTPTSFGPCGPSSGSLY